MTGTGLSFAHVTKHFGDTVAVDNLSAQVAPGSLTALLGPSGCGKSTTLAMIAGLVVPDAGDIRVGSATMLGVPTQRRPVGLVFQKPLLFPHLTVEQNVAFGLRMRRLDRGQTSHRTRDMLDRVQLGGLARRRVGELSGGQEQRVALARALVLRPQALLLDEPFSQLDATLRAEMRHLVQDLHRDSAVTTVFVTHDQAEAVEVADTIALMLDGRLAGQGSPEVFYTRPPSLAAARFFGATNELAGIVADGRFVSADGRLRLPCTTADGPAILVVRPETLRLTAPTQSFPSGPAIDATVTAIRFAGTHLAVDARLASGRALTVHAPVGTHIEAGASVSIGVPANAATVFAAPVP